MTELDDRLEKLREALKRRSNAAIDRNIDAFKGTVAATTSPDGVTANNAVQTASVLTLGALTDIATAYSEVLKVATTFVQEPDPPPPPPPNP
jgi:hypothetical protein